MTFILSFCNLSSTTKRAIYQISRIDINNSPLPSKLSNCFEDFVPELFGRDLDDAYINSEIPLQKNRRNSSFSIRPQCRRINKKKPERKNLREESTASKFPNESPPPSPPLFQRQEQFSPDRIERLNEKFPLPPPQKKRKIITQKVIAIKNESLDRYISRLLHGGLLFER